MRLSHSIEIDAPPDVVWKVWRDVERWPEWTASVTRVEPLQSGPFAIGYRARVVQPKLPRAIWRVTELEEGRRFVWIYTSPGVRLTASHLVEPSARGTRADSFVELAGPFAGLVGRLTRATTERYLAMEAEGLKARSEESAAGAEAPRR
jgi:uncharacterized membrane protein